MTLNIVENADDAETYVIESLRKMGNDALHCWADQAVIKRQMNYMNSTVDVTSDIWGM